MGILPNAHSIEMLIVNGELSEAQSQLQEALAKDRQCIDAWQLLGALQMITQKTESAIESFLIAISLSEQFPEVISRLSCTLALCYFKTNEYDLVMRWATKALQINPKLIEAWIYLGKAQFFIGDVEQSLNSFLQGLKLDPDHPWLLFCVGDAMVEKCEFDQAIPYYRAAIESDKKHLFDVDAYCHIAIAYMNLGNYQEGWVANEKALSLNPQYKKALLMKGDLLFFMGEHEQGTAVYHTLNEKYPNDPEIELKHGDILRSILRVDEAILIHSLLALRYPDHYKAKVNLGMNLLLTGDFKRGFQQYEHRLEMRNIVAPYMEMIKPIPIWEGEEIDGKILVVHQEQGLGDAIQCLRYVPYLNGRYGCKVILCLRNELNPLFQHLAFPHPDQFVKADLRVSLMSLPYIFNTEISSIPPPVSITGVRLNPVLNRIGLSWKGNPLHKQDRKRSIDLRLFEPLLKIPGLTFVSLQKEVTAEEKELLDVYQLEQPRLESFTDTVHELEKCELVITADTVIAHLAASMGILTWILLAYSPDWRWMLDRADSPWYPSVRLFRQSSLDSWFKPCSEVYFSILKLHSVNGMTLV